MQRLVLASISFIFFFIIGVSVSIPPVFAVDACPTGQFDPLCKLQIGNDSTLIANIINILLVVAVLLAIVFLIYGGIRWIMSGGDKAKVDTARSTIISAIIGLVIAFAAFFIISLVQYFFGINDCKDKKFVFSLPQLTDNASTAPCPK